MVKKKKKERKKERKTPKIITYLQCQKSTMKIQREEKALFEDAPKNRHLVIAPKIGIKESCNRIYRQPPSRRH